MIGFLKGKLAMKSPSMVLMDVNGVGYEINISLQTFTKIKDAEEILLYTQLIVREDSQTLFGFYSYDEKELFNLLISVSGIGANTARMMLSSLESNEIRNAIIMGNDVKLTSIKGVGAKTAQRLVLELKDKAYKQQSEMGVDGVLVEVESNPEQAMRQEAIDALVALGISKSVAEKAVIKVLKSDSEMNTVEIIIKSALQNL